MKLRCQTCRSHAASGGREDCEVQKAISATTRASNERLQVLPPKLLAHFCVRVLQEKQGGPRTSCRPLHAPTPPPHRTPPRPPPTHTHAFTLPPPHPHTCARAGTPTAWSVHTPTHPGKPKRRRQAGQALTKDDRQTTPTVRWAPSAGGQPPEPTARGALCAGRRPASGSPRGPLDLRPSGGRVPGPWGWEPNAAEGRRSGLRAEARADADRSEEKGRHRPCFTCREA